MPLCHNTPTTVYAILQYTLVLYMSTLPYYAYYAEVGSTAVQKYRGTVTRYFFSTAIGNDDTF